MVQIKRCQFCGNRIQKWEKECSNCDGKPKKKPQPKKEKAKEEPKEELIEEEPQEDKVEKKIKPEYNQGFKEHQNKLIAKGENTRERVYNIYSERLIEREERPTLQEIGEVLGITRERVRQVMEELIDKGKITRFDFQKNQNVDIPTEWFKDNT